MTITQVVGCALIGCVFVWASERPWPYYIGGAVLFVVFGFALSYVSSTQAEVYARIDAKYRSTHISDDEFAAFRCGKNLVLSGCDKFRGGTP